MPKWSKERFLREITSRAADNIKKKNNTVSKQATLRGVWFGVCVILSQRRYAIRLRYTVTQK